MTMKTTHKNRKEHNKNRWDWMNNPLIRTF